MTTNTIDYRRLNINVSNETHINRDNLKDKKANSDNVLLKNMLESLLIHQQSYSNDCDTVEILKGLGAVGQFDFWSDSKEDIYDD